MISVKTESKWKGQDKYDAFLKNMKGIKGSFVTIGFHDGAGSYADGTSVIQVALWNEFGTETIPERSFIRSTVYGHESQINSWREELISQIMEGKCTVRHALETIGFRLRELMKNKIGSNVPPPNSESTTEHKRREGVAPRTLVETGLMQRSVEFYVVMK